jgi:two-component system, NtrC family, sensor histidine kinase HydH
VAPRPIRPIRTQDFVWLLLFSILAVISPRHEPLIAVLLLLLAVPQVLETKFAFFETMRGRVLSIVVKIALAYLLTGFTGGINSSFYFLLLLPVVSAGSWFGVAGTILCTLVVVGAYLSFLLVIDWDVYVLGPLERQELVLRVTFMALIGYLTNTLAEAAREQSAKYRAAAEQLAAANRSLQEAEAAVRRTERLAALGQLTAGLAHELRNPLGTIRVSAEMLSKSLPEENEMAREMAGFIRSEVDRTNSLVTRFLEFARPVPLRLEPADIAEVIDQAVKDLERQASHGRVTVYRNYSPDIAPFPLDAELMGRAIFNLLLNAAQATPEGGAVTVKTRLAGGSVEISVIDRGAGIDPKHLENIFNPFFTTKPEGVGLGLAIVSKIVDDHGGKMTVESEPGKGSVFRILLPLRGGAPAGSPS